MFHDDRNPSLQLYDDGTWYCYGACRTGGSIYDFASNWWGLDTRGHQFLALRQRLADELLPVASTGEILAATAAASPTAR